MQDIEGTVTELNFKPQSFDDIPDDWYQTLEVRN